MLGKDKTNKYVASFLTHALVMEPIKTGTRCRDNNFNTDFFVSYRMLNFAFLN